MIERFPPLAAGCCVLIYWGAVVNKARRARHGVNLIPRERTGRWLRVIWVPVVVAWCAQPWLALRTHPISWWLQPAAGIAWTIVGFLGAALCVVATVGSFSCWREMGKSWRLGINPNEKTKLVFSGPYRFVRHPIYSLSILLAVGTLAAAPTPLMLTTALVHIFLLQIEARREEKYLVERHGDSYAEYQKHVGRFVPRHIS
ncbi:MAG TPA: isoprenylcysteine carboxylmethyltransferase family protein [Chthoniobacterales bacterium]